VHSFAGAALMATPPVEVIHQIAPDIHLRPESMTCPICKGSGTARDPRHRKIVCPSCAGAGQIIGWTTAPTTPRTGASPAFTILMLLVFVGLILAGLVYAASHGSASGAPTASTGDPSASAPATAPSVPPSAVAVPAAATTWTPAVCSWAINGLTEDSQLDRASAASGPDPRFPGQTAASWTAYYTNLANQWDQVRYLVTNDCLISTGVPDGATVATCSDALVWLPAAAAAHDADLQRAGATAADQTWDRGWAVFYRTLAADLKVNCGVD
jgi:hypothetical protein